MVVGDISRAGAAETSARNFGIDVGRTVAFTAVVAIHLSPVFYASYAENFLFSELSRFAVPFFFVASSYWSYGRLVRSTRETARRAGERIALPFLFWLGFYNINPLLQGKLDWRWFVNGGYGFHLWFLPSLAVSLVMASAVLRSANLRILSGSAILLYLGGLAYGSYGPPLHLGLSPWWSTRDGPFFALPFVVIGCVLRHGDYRTSLGGGAVLFGLGAVAQLAEAYWLGRHGMDPVRIDHCASTLLFGTGAFLFFRELPSFPILRWLALAGPYTFAAYAIHGWVLGQFQGVAAFGGTASLIVLGAAATSLLFSFLATFAFR